ncbi:MAG TPA: sodium:solute symporter family protein [Vicinamibacterales bacterium]|nr:sodium:solute symporter family protein [Vicinamibacterales bacterium]
MTLFVALLIVYSIGLIVLGSWVGRAVRQSTDFFVAGRTLGPGLLVATFLAANIGAGSTVGATGYAYSDGLAAWWWNGSAGLGSLVLAFWIGPRVWREAKTLGFLTVGDFLEYHFGRDVRGLAAAIIWMGSFFILCGQLRGAAEVIHKVAGLPLAIGALLATLATTTYFVMGGLKSAAVVNRIQLFVILVGFVIAAPLAQHSASLAGASAGDTSFWRGANVGWPTLFLLGPAFFLSPGLIQKAYGAKDERSLTMGVAINGVALLFFAVLPVMLGLAARALHPGLERAEMALPTVLADDVTPFVGAIALAAVLSAEISSADAVLFMLATSGARDFYKGFFRPNATDGDVLRVARLVAIGGSIVGYVLTFALDSVVDALTMFYSIMIVTLFAPIMGGLFLPKAGRWSALASMLVGVMTLVTIHIATGGAGFGWATPAFLGLIASGLTYLMLAVF